MLLRFTVGKPQRTFTKWLLADYVFSAVCVCSQRCLYFWGFGYVVVCVSSVPVYKINLKEGTRITWDGSAGQELSDLPEAKVTAGYFCLCLLHETSLLVRSPSHASLFWHLKGDPGKPPWLILWQKHSL